MFVISHFPDPRINKRLQVTKEIGQTALVFWDRKTVKIWDIIHLDVENIKIDVTANYTNPLKRIFPTFKFAYKALKHIKRLKPKCLYVANVDMLMIAKIYSFGRKNKPNIIYEIADLNKLIADEQKGLLGKGARKILTYLERHLCKEISILIVTSEKFFENYYSNFIPKSKLLFMPNVPDLRVFENYSRKKTGRFTIGFIGAVRYKNQMKMLINVAEKCNVDILFAGAGLDNEIEVICKEKSFVSYYGKYNYDKEISNLYEKVDCVYAVYDADLNNVKIALPNKLYESIYCELPIIVSKCTYLAELVEKMNVGVAVSHKDSQDLINVLIKLSTDKGYYNKLVQGCIEHKSEINIENYNDRLKNIVGKLVK